MSTGIIGLMKLKQIREIGSASMYRLHVQFQYKSSYVQHCRGKGKGHGAMEKATTSKARKEAQDQENEDYVDPSTREIRMQLAFACCRIEHNQSKSGAYDERLVRRGCFHVDRLARCLGENTVTRRMVRCKDRKLLTTEGALPSANGEADWNKRPKARPLLWYSALFPHPNELLSLARAIWELAFRAKKSKLTGKRDGVKCLHSALHCV